MTKLTVRQRLERQVSMLKKQNDDVWKQDSRLQNENWSLNNKLTSANAQIETYRKSIRRAAYLQSLGKGLAIIGHELKTFLIDIKLLIAASLLFLVGFMADNAFCFGNSSYYSGCPFSPISISSRWSVIFTPVMILFGSLALWRWLNNQSKYEPKLSGGRWLALGFVALLSAITVIIVVALLRLDSIITILKLLKIGP